jgi:hypothetical protein
MLSDFLKSSRRLLSSRSLDCGGFIFRRSAAPFGREIRVTRMDGEKELDMRDSGLIPRSCALRFAPAARDRQNKAHDDPVHDDSGLAFHPAAQWPAC